MTSALQMRNAASGTNADEKKLGRIGWSGRQAARMTGPASTSEGAKGSAATILTLTPARAAAHAGARGPLPEARSSRPVADPQGRDGGAGRSRDARSGAAARSPGLPPLLAGRASRLRGAGRLGAGDPDRARRGADPAPARGIGRRDAAALQRAEGG